MRWAGEDAYLEHGKLLSSGRGLRVGGPSESPQPVKLEDRHAPSTPPSVGS